MNQRLVKRYRQLATKVAQYEQERDKAFTALLHSLTADELVEVMTAEQVPPLEHGGSATKCH